MSGSGVLEELGKYTYVVLYSEKTPRVDKLLAHTDDDCCCIDVSTSDDLRDMISNAYQIVGYPVMLYRGKTVYPEDSIPERLDTIDSEKCAAVKAFLADFVLEDGLTVFIKGTLEKPYCKFTKQLVACISEKNIGPVKDFDIFTDPDLRYYMKQLNGWPTFPMIYINGKFIGGLDVFKDLILRRAPIVDQLIK